MSVGRNCYFLLICPCVNGHGGNANEMEFQELRTVNDIFNESLETTDLLAVALNQYSPQMFRTPDSLWNETCFNLSPQVTLVSLH